MGNVRKLDEIDEIRSINELISKWTTKKCDYNLISNYYFMDAFFRKYLGFYYLDLPKEMRNNLYYLTESENGEKGVVIEIPWIVALEHNYFCVALILQPSGKQVAYMGKTYEYFERRKRIGLGYIEKGNFKLFKSECPYNLNAFLDCIGHNVVNI